MLEKISAFTFEVQRLPELIRYKMRNLFGIPQTDPKACNELSRAENRLNRCAARFNDLLKKRELNLGLGITYSERRISPCDIIGTKLLTAKIEYLDALSCYKTAKKLFGRNGRFHQRTKFRLGNNRRSNSAQDG